MVSVRNLYLFVYNALQSVGWWLIFVKTVLFAYENRNRILDSNPAALYADVGPLLRLCQGIGLLEIVHAAAGITRSALLPVVMQQGGRLFLIMVVINPYYAVQSDLAILTLIASYSAIEIVRYPLYALEALGSSPSILKTLRYNLPLILYPVGFGSEFRTAYVGLPHVKASPVIETPNNLLYFVLLALMVALPFAAFLLLRNILSQRNKHQHASKPKRN